MAEKKLSPAERFKEMLNAAKEQDSFHVEAAKVELSEQIYIVMEEKGVSEAELSRRLQVSRAYINKILRGNANLTIESLVKIGRALGTEFKFAFGRSRSAIGPVTLPTVVFPGVDRKRLKSTSKEHVVKIPKNLKSTKTRKLARPLVKSEQ